MNYYKDEEEEFDKTKLLCRFMNPIAASDLFDRKVEVTTSTKDVLFDQMSKDLKGKYTPQELEEIMKDPKHFAELDVIEKA
jgi:hypothetical protein